MLSWIPLLGPIIDGMVSIFTKVEDTKLGTITVERNDDVAEAKISAQIIHDTNDDISLRIMRDIALFFPVVWGALIGWDTIVSYKWKWLMFHVNNYPTSVGYIPYAAYVFLFGCIGLNIWKRR